MFRLALVGKTNVGKSTLFNRLCGRSLAIVNGRRGVSRDRNEAEGHLGPIDFKVVDTAGWEGDSPKASLEERMTRQSEAAMVEADVCLFLVNGREEIDEVDRALAQRLRVLNVPTILVINKCENLRASQGAIGKDFYRLGFEVIVPISAEHGDGMNILYDAIEPYYGEYVERTGAGEDPQWDDDAPIQVAIIGQPNVGKSTLVNQLISQERLLTGPEAGITRDSIVVERLWENRRINIVDTAGIGKRHKSGSELDQLATARSFMSLDYGQVVVLVVDATAPLDRQDFSLASRVIEEGRGMVFALNKCDLVKDWKKQEQLLESILERNPSLLGYPLVPICATEGFNLEKLMEAVAGTFRNWDRRIATSKLNGWLREVEQEHVPPLFRSRPVRLKYISQIKTRPPTFALSTNSPTTLYKGSTYYWFLCNRLKKDFNLSGTPIRLLLRKSDNPYDPGDGKRGKTK
ncbi:MAG: ribosome biogenesis GTPase Der [Rickettsiales bacterium]|jgi:GTP-binding protein|nr:ribosome biogenesis GTPase Der [Rickettsiales bacterium]